MCRCFVVSGYILFSISSILKGQVGKAHRGFWKGETKNKVVESQQTRVNIVALLKSF